jgi:hypothetical protein
MHRNFLPAVVVGALANSRVSSAAKSSARCASAAAVLIWLVAGAAANGQTGRGVAYDRTAVIQAICRQYPAAGRGANRSDVQPMHARAPLPGISRLTGLSVRIARADDLPRWR